MSKLIPLTKGQFAVVDDEDAGHISQFRWMYDGYAIRHESRKLHHGKQKRRSMQHEILNLPSSILIDHIDGNKLNNCKSNLRPCTIQQNTWNSRKPSGNYSSRYKGVYLHKASGLYWAYIRLNGKTHSLGYYKDEVSAARARDAAAREYHGEFAYLNFPERQPA